MANHGANTNGSQFFIMHQDYQLKPDYVLFAWVTKGMDVVDALANVPTSSGDRPLTPVVIKTVTIKP
jgi:cyclophilin family peptidyl-prolyl cis-trans isomerase